LTPAALLFDSGLGLAPLKAAVAEFWLMSNCCCSCNPTFMKRHSLIQCYCYQLEWTSGVSGTEEETVESMSEDAGLN